MADVFLIVANKKNQSGEAGIKYYPDCTTSISHNFTNEVTEYPVENGVSISDHVQAKNKTFSFSAIYNQHNLNVWLDDKVSREDRINDAYQNLLSLYNSKAVFTFVSRYDSYDNCVITNLTIPVAPDDGNTLMFTAEIKQLRTASTEQVTLVQVDNVITSKKDDATSSSSSGKKKTERSALEALTKALEDALTLSGNIKERTEINDALIKGGS
jgi:hypothetical protein